MTPTGSTNGNPPHHDQMKPTINPLVIVCALLLPAAPLSAAPRGQAGDQAKLATMVRDPAMARAALHEMMKSAETKRMMARELARDREFRSLYAVEIGSGAPHQERNPSDHPELFQGRKPPTR